MFGYGGKNYLSNEDLDNATVTAERTTEARVAVGGLEVPGRVLWMTGWGMGSARKQFLDALSAWSDWQTTVRWPPATASTS